ncbi:MAG TPA: LysR family transcriptional regulator [Stellaceae bacterium]|nr:LysR family transcriptional regulator [Stellaceae bacterium]
MDIRSVDLNLLKAFDALMSERAVTRAAARIGLSQPAMSHALSRLRGMFGDELFVRTPAGMEPTAHAREVATLVSAAITQIEAALNLGAAFDPASSTAVFTAGMAEYAEIALVGQLAAALAERAPHATLRLLPLNGADAVEQLEAGAIDVAVAHLRTLPAPIEYQVLLRDPFVVVLHKAHKLAAAPLSVEAYAAQRHILVSPRGLTTGAIDRFLVDFGLRRHISLLVATYLALPAALAAADYVATVPRRAAERIAAAGDIAILPLPLDLTMTVTMAWHRRAASEPAQNWFRALLVEAAGAMPNAA